MFGVSITIYCPKYISRVPGLVKRNSTSQHCAHLQEGLRWRKSWCFRSSAECHIEAQKCESPQEQYCPLQWPRRPVNVEYWRWRTVIKIHWKWKAHINELEARGALAALKWRTRSRAGLGQRWLHLVDSFIVIAVMSRKRSTSKILNRVIKKFAILELASFTQCVFAFTCSHENPSDAPSRDTG